MNQTDMTPSHCLQREVRRRPGCGKQNMGYRSNQHDNCLERGQTEAQVYVGVLELNGDQASSTIVKVSVAQWCLHLCNSMDCSPPGSSVHGILQERILEWAVFPLSRGSSQPRDRTQVSCRQILYHLSHQGSPNNGKLIHHGPNRNGKKCYYTNMLFLNKEIIFKSVKELKVIFSSA